jgi:hypothetical protein
MTPEEEKDLLELGAALQAAKASPFLARCLVAAFSPVDPATRLHACKLPLHPLTFRSWLALEAARSPFLVDDWQHMPEPSHVVAALRAISGQPVTLDWLLGHETWEVIVAVKQIRAVVREAFATALQMRNPEDRSTAAPTDHGFGTWIALMAILCERMGKRADELLDHRVDQAFALAATWRYLGGAEPKGANYLEREVELDGEKVDLFGGVPDREEHGDGQAQDGQHEQAGNGDEPEQTLGGAAAVEQPQQTGNDD